jgi:hypothetical protein
MMNRFQVLLQISTCGATWRLDNFYKRDFRINRILGGEVWRCRLTPG